MSNKKAIKFIRFLENAWIVVGVTTAGIGIYETFRLGIEESYMFFIFSLLAGILYSLRRKQRTRMEEESEDKTD
ncbi:MAG: hypothetical protein JKX73_04590 [Flavobacteriales bacterium]|nr:hypothetical protein [Flavobacteriales bacterium]